MARMRYKEMWIKLEQEVRYLRSKAVDESKIDDECKTKI